MFGWSTTLVLIVDGSVVVLVEIDTCCPILVRLNLASDGEHELNDVRLRTSSGARGSCRGRQKSRSVAWGDVCEVGDHADGTKGRIKRCADLIIVLGGESAAGLIVEAQERSPHRGLLVDVHVEDKLEQVKSWRCRRPLIIITLICFK